MADEDMRLGLAVSGGPDSMAMLLLAHQATPGQIEAATVDHGLRDESGREAQFVADTCSSLGIPHEILAVEIGKGNVQASARAARYQALASWAKRRGISAIATAHHADDQAETLLMRLNRSSGLAGLAGVRRQTMIGSLRVLRPLLDWRKADLISVCESADIAFVADPSNENVDFDRARVRKELERSDWLDAEALALSANHLAEVFRFVESVVEEDWSRAVTRREGTIVYQPFAQRLIAIETLWRIYREFSVSPSRADCATAHDRLVEGKNASLAGILATAIDDGEGGQVWRFSPEPARQT